jgi:hypothetical protein
MFDMILKGFLRDHFKAYYNDENQKSSIIARLNRLLPTFVEGGGLGIFWGSIYIYTSCVRRKYRVRVTKNCVTMNTSYNHDIIVI